MTRLNLEHIIRAAGTIADDTDLIVIGSQSILGQFPDAHAVLLASLEAEVYPRNHSERSDLIDGTIGQDSPFHRQFGYYAHGIDSTTATLPQGWEQRLVLVSSENTGGVRGWCLEVHDLAIAKLIAGREKDLEFVADLIRHKYATRDTLRARLAATSVAESLTQLVAGRIEAAAHA